MDDLHCFAFVEDAPSAAVARKLVLERNASSNRKLRFHDGHPTVTRGFGNIKRQCPALLKMAKQGLVTFCLTGLDRAPCPRQLLTEWFGVVELPRDLVFRIAVREVEAWVLADTLEWSKFIGIAAGNFTLEPELLPDPKQHLLNVVGRKGKKAYHREMLPSGSAHIGPRYNEVLCEFIDTRWSPARAAERSPSLARAIAALKRIS